MKNLKKVLALVLAVALMMGFATFAGATDFTDDSDIEHAEAVEVMSGIGVINGYPDGSFRPDGDVTRAQMATMVAYIVAGGENVGSLYAGANTFTDCTTHWARGYIAYANQTGIIAGVGNGRFDPDGNVTGAEAAKMMLCALGYDQDTEGYTGAGWSVNALADARTLGLLDGLTGVDMNADFSRGDAAQLMFNALQATMVEYERGSIVVEGGDSTVTIGGSEASPIGNNVSDDYRAVDRDAYMQMCEQYFENLSLDNADSDSFGRPAHTWTYSRDELGTFVDEDAVVIYTAETDASDVRSDLRNYDYASGLVALRNSVEDIDVDSYSDVAALTADGTVVEVYANDSREVTDVIVIETDYAEVTNVNDTRATFTISYGGGSEVIDEDSDFYALYDNVEEDDILAVCYAGDSDRTILDLYVPETVSGEITRVNNAGDTATVAGESITAAAIRGNIFADTLGQDSVVYLSSAGYAIYVDAATSSSADYMYVTNIWKESNYGNQTYYARGVLTDGTIETLEVANVATSGSAYVTDGDADTFDGESVRYGTGEGEALYYGTNLTVPVVAEYVESDSESGLYVLVYPEAPAANKAGVTAAHTGEHGSDAITVDGFRLSSDVTFVYVTGDGDDIVVSTGSRTRISDDAAHQVVVEEVDGRYQGTVVFINSASAASEDVFYISDDNGSVQYVNANGDTRTGREVEYYAYGATDVDDVQTMIVTNRSAVASGFYTRSTDGEAYSLDSYNERVFQGALTDAYGGVINDAYILADDAVVIDVTDSGYGSVRALENLADDDTMDVQVAFTFDSDDVVETVYIQSIDSSDTSLSRIRVNGTTVAAGGSITVGEGRLNVSATPTDVDAGVAYSYSVNGGAATTSAPSLTDSQTCTVTITVTAENGDTTSYTVTVNCEA